MPKKTNYVKAVIEMGPGYQIFFKDDKFFIEFKASGSLSEVKDFTYEEHLPAPQTSGRGNKLPDKSRKK